MIKEFSVLYTGHVLEGDGIGFGGTPANDRSYPNERLSEAFPIALKMAKALEALDYDIFWMAEHHFQREGYECIPNLLMLSVWLAQQTQKIKLGSAFNILPMWHPIRLAEDFAMADILTNGRVIFGAGRGYHTREVETFGAPMQDPDANRELFEEQFEIFLKACNDESFSHQGKHYTLPPTVPYRGYELKDLTLVPRPANRPVQTWQPIVSGSVRGLDFMAKHGINGIIMGTASHHVEAMVNAYHQANVRQSKHLALGQNIALGWWWRLDDTYEQAKENLRGAFEEHVKFAAPLGMLRYNDQQMERLGPGGVASHIAAGVEFDKVLESGAWFCGTPKDMIAHLKHIEDKYPGIEQIVLPFPMSLPADEAIDQAARFAREVMPAFKGK